MPLQLAPPDVSAAALLLSLVVAAPALLAVVLATLVSLFRRGRSAREHRPDECSVAMTAILDRLPDGVLVLDAAGRVRLSNDAAARLLPAGDAPLAERLPEGPLRDAFRAARAADVEAELTDAAGAARTVRASIQPLPGAGGLVATLRDVTDEREAARAEQRRLDDITHDFRSPMTAILGFVRMIRARDHGPVTAEQEECLDHVLEQSERLLSLVDSRLDVVRLDADVNRLDRAEVDLDAILAEVTSGFAASARARGVALEREDEDGPPPPVAGDAQLVYRLFANLVGNALKFTPELGRVRVSSRVVPGGVEVSVEDSGVGIAREDQARLFERFVRVGGARNEASGHGLGLSIAKEIVERHGGRIAVESEGERRGTIFRVFLPGAASDGAPAAADSAPPRRPRRVLVLDDGRRFGIEALRRALGERGDSVRIVSSDDRLGDEARAFRPDEILVTREPGASALDALRALALDSRVRRCDAL